MKLKGSERYKKKIASKIRNELHCSRCKTMYNGSALRFTIYLLSDLFNHFNSNSFAISSKAKNILVLWFWKRKKWIVEPLDGCKWCKLCRAFEKKNQKWILFISNKWASAARLAVEPHGFWNLKIIADFPRNSNETKSHNPFEFNSENSIVIDKSSPSGYF